MTGRYNRQIVLDTETTGLSPQEGHRIVEIGAVELVNLHPTGRVFQAYLNPDREIPDDAARIHGITNEKVAGSPRFREVVDLLLEFVGTDELVIHNAPFDLAFLNAELTQCGRPTLDQHPVVDTLAEARRRHPRQRNNLDALCKRYAIDNSERTLHGALLDAQILADVYVAMLGGHQITLTSMTESWQERTGDVAPLEAQTGVLIPSDRSLPVQRNPRYAVVSPEEVSAHAALLERLGDGRIWREALEAGAS